jgi:hypothetical protein
MAMRRLVIGLTLACFMTLAGVEVFHSHHAGESAAGCRICLIGAQAVAHIAHTPPSLKPQPVSTREIFIPHTKIAVSFGFHFSARGPPQA